MCSRASIERELRVNSLIGQVAIPMILSCCYEVLPTLLNPLRRKLGRVYADGAYDSKASHRLIARKGATACIPPRKNAGLWKKGHPRNEAVQVMRKEGLAHWKKISGYHRRSLAETAMFRFKQLMAGQIT
ncbi:hypothetical protein VO71_18130, partial [Aeromonas salmonicida subsp. smithia]